MTSGDVTKDFDLMPLFQKEAQPLSQGCQNRSFIQKGLSLLFSKAGGSNTFHLFRLSTNHGFIPSYTLIN